MKVAAGKWRDLPEGWEGINGLYEKPAAEIEAEARRQDEKNCGSDQWLGVYDVGVFEEQLNQYIGDGREMFDPLTYWVKFITEEGEKVI